MSLIAQKVIGLLAEISMTKGPSDAQTQIDKLGISPELFKDESLRELFILSETLLRNSRPLTLESIVSAGAPLPGAKNGKLNALFVACMNSANELVTMAESSLASLVEHLKTLCDTDKITRFASGVLKAAEDSKIPRTRILDDIGTFHQNTVAGIYEYRTGDEDVLAQAEELDAREKGLRAPMVPSGIDALDGVIGGFLPVVTLVCGLPGSGKSALLGTSIGELTKRGVKCGLFGLEDGTSWLPWRLVSREAGIPLIRLLGRSHDQRKFNPAEVERISTAQGNVAFWLKNLSKCAPPSNMKPSDLVAIAKDWILNRGVKIIFVDHIGELDHGKSHERLDLGIRETVIALRHITETYRIPIVLAAHLKNEYAKHIGSPPSLDMVAESAYPGRMSRLALGVWQQPNSADMSVTVMKFTSGKAGMTIDIPRMVASALVCRTSKENENEFRRAA